MKNIFYVFMLAALNFSLSFSAEAGILIDLNAVKAIESEGNYLAYNVQTKCYGLYQISEVCLKDFNQLNRAHYNPQDLFNPQINEEIAVWYFKRIERMLKAYEIPTSLTTILASYNWGIGNVLSWYRRGASFSAMPKMTRQYIRKYQELTRL